MDNQPLLIAGGSLVVGILLAVAITNSRTNAKIDAALEQAEEASFVAVSDATEAMNARIAELEALVSENSVSVSEGLEEKLAAVQADLADKVGAVSDAAAEQASALEDALSKLAAMGKRILTGSGPQKSDLGAHFVYSESRRVGQTAIFADGAVRAFVSALGDDSGAAKLSVNGAAASVGMGGMVPISLDGTDCSVVVMSLDENGVVLGSDCGSIGASSAAADLPPAPEQGYGAGTTASLADGDLRVFISGLADDGASARIAVNGVDLQTVVSGSSIDVMSGDRACTVTVTGVGNGLVGLDGDCG